MADETVATPSITGRPTIVLSANPEIMRTMGRMDSDMTPASITVDPAHFERVPTQVFRQLEQLHPIGALPITLNQFLRVSRSLMLRRLQDIVEGTTYSRVPNAIPLNRSIMIPQAVGDLIYALGNYYVEATGTPIQLQSVAIPAANAPNWTTLDGATLQAWCQTTAIMQRHYMMVEFPRPSNILGAPLPLMITHTANHMVRVKSRYTGPQLSDALLRAVNEEEIFAGMGYNFHNCRFIMTQQMHVETLVSRYVASYVRD